MKPTLENLGSYKIIAKLYNTATEYVITMNIVVKEDTTK